MRPALIQKMVCAGPVLNLLSRVSERVGAGEREW